MPLDVHFRQTLKCKIILGCEQKLLCIGSLVYADSIFCLFPDLRALLLCSCDVFSVCRNYTHFFFILKGSFFKNYVYVCVSKCGFVWKGRPEEGVSPSLPNSTGVRKGCDGY